jgi:hypothetical protein
LGKQAPGDTTMDPWYIVGWMLVFLIPLYCLFAIQKAIIRFMQITDEQNERDKDAPKDKDE